MYYRWIRRRSFGWMRLRLVRKLPMPLPANFIDVTCSGFSTNRTRGKKTMDGTLVGLAIPRSQAEIGSETRWTIYSESADFLWNCPNSHVPLLQDRQREL